MHTHVFLWPFGFRGSAWKLCWLLPSWDTLSRSMVKLVGGECPRSQDLRIINDDLSLCGDEELAWWYVTWSNDIVNGGDNTEEVQSLTFQSENSRSGLNWLCLAMALLKTLFCERVLWNLRSMIGRQQRTACALFPSWMCRFWRNWTSGAVLVVLVLLLQEIDHYSGTSLLL